MPATNRASIKLSSDFVEEARREAEVLHRSVGAQVEHWAKLGRAFENTPGFDIRKVRGVLEGRLKIEDLTAAEQDKFFEELGDYFDNPDQKMRDYFAELGAREGAVGSDGKGGIVRRTASGDWETIA
ncbi:MAG: hypothetical protein JWR47_326 [Phenylobacterium sp.]|jgi:hypothetical protein|nr:hypothetical protein [Phenylobacterium sp.]MDB5434069.1 hypothetical protein [Phenylobacterium sp.]MDB5462919.1 hypothetical protein [Phenylobacterium sp.]